MATLAKLLTILAIAAATPACVRGLHPQRAMHDEPDPDVGDLACAPDVTIDSLVEHYGAIPPQRC